MLCSGFPVNFDTTSLGGEGVENPRKFCTKKCRGVFVPPGSVNRGICVGQRDDLERSEKKSAGIGSLLTGFVEDSRLVGGKAVLCIHLSRKKSRHAALRRRI
jgi:hypothetical protein